jgi:hypothetical protein
MSIKDDNYFTVKGWMINKLGLSGSALVAYAVIYGFSQDGQSSFCGSISYLASCAGVTDRGIQKSLHELIEKGYINKKETIKNNVTYFEYRAVLPEDIHSEQSSPPPVNKVPENPERGEQSSPNIDQRDIDQHTDQAFVKKNNQENIQENIKKKRERIINLWQSNSDVFNPCVGFHKPLDFNAWLENADITIGMIDTAVKNFLDGVRNGAIERRFIPGHPDTFFLNGGIQRYQAPYKNRSPPEPENDWSNFGVKG